MAVHTCTHDRPTKTATTGSTVNFTGANHFTNGTATIYFNYVKVGTASIDGTGAFTYALTIPIKRDYGTRAVVTINDGQGHVTNHELNIPN